MLKNFSRIYSVILILIISLGVLLTEIANAKPSITHIKIALAFRANDPYDQNTQQLIDGIKVANKFFERKHPTYKIDLYDYRFKAHNLSSIAQIATKICSDKIPFVIGAEMSEEALILGEILNSCHAVFITPTATSPKVSKQRPYVFRMSASDEIVARKLAEFVYDHFKNDRIAIIDDVSLPYTDFLAKSFYASYTKLNNQQPIIKKVLHERMDYTDIIDLFIKNNVKVVAMLTYDIALKRFAFQAAEKNYFPIYIGSDGWGSNKYLSAVLQDNDKLDKKFIGYRNYYWNEKISNKTAKEFIDNFILQHHHYPNAWNAIGFDSSWVILNAILKKEPRTDLLKSFHFTNLDLVTSTAFKFDSDNSPIKQFHIYKVTAHTHQLIKSYKSHS